MNMINGPIFALRIRSLCLGSLGKLKAQWGGMKGLRLTKFTSRIDFMVLEWFWINFFVWKEVFAGMTRERIEKSLVL